MGLIDKIAPIWALKRQIAKNRLKRMKELNKRGFDAVSGNRKNYSFSGLSTESPDSAIYDDLEALRNNVRRRERESGFSKGAIQRIVKSVVGVGIYPQARCVPDKEFIGQPKINQRMASVFNYQAEKFFRRWAKKSDIRLKQNFWDQQAEIFGAYIRDGEALIIGRNSNNLTRSIPYCLETREIDYLQTPRSEINNPKITGGIEHDSEGVPRFYYLTKSHPGNAIHIQDSDIEQVDAFFASGRRRVHHLFSPLRRPGQTRGYSDFASGLKTLQNMDKYWEAEILAALEDACMTGIIETSYPTGFNANYTESSDSDDYDRIHEFAPNMMHYLQPGEKFSIHRPNRPNNQFEAFTNILMSDPASALDVPVEIISMNWKGLNYSNARTILLQFYASCFYLSTIFIRQFLEDIWENVISDGVINGDIQATGFDRRKDDYLATKWIPRVYRRWVDPQKESNGKTNDLNNNIETLSDIHSERGDDWEEKLTQRAVELKRMKELETEYGIEFKSEQEARPSEPGEETDNGNRAVIPGPWVTS